MFATLQLAEPNPLNPRISETFTCGRIGGATIDIYRLLTGSLNIIRSPDQKIVKCRFDFAKQTRGVARASDLKIVKGLFGEDVLVEDARLILSRFRSKNVKFFKMLRTELTHCVFNLQINSSVEAFLHFYRALEKLAVAFPILYVSGQSDFNRTHEMLKNLLSKDGDGELKFAAKFCKFIADNSDILAEYRVEFAFPVESALSYSAILRELKEVVPTEIRAAIIEGEGKFEIPYELVPDLIVSCRNRLFHNSNSGQRNFDIDKIGGASAMCEGLVKAGLHWLYLTYVEVVRNRAALV